MSEGREEDIDTLPGVNKVCYEIRRYNGSVETFANVADILRSVIVIAQGLR